MKKIYSILIFSSLLLVCLYIFKVKTFEPIKSSKGEHKVLVKEVPAKNSLVQKNVIENKNTASASNKAKPFIHAPLKSAIINFKKEKVSATKATTLTSIKGTQIIIPENAFVDEHGKIVKGNVDLQYREFHDHSDIFLSGIPMTYDNGQLESAGMIEITASLNSKPVYVNPNNKIKINMPSNNTDPDFNLYYLDTKEKKWKLKEENLTATNAAEIKSEREIQTPDNFKVLDDVYYDTYNNIPDSIKIKKVSVKGKKVKLVEPKQVSGNYYQLNIDINQYPELSIYQGILWQAVDTKKTRAIASILPKKLNMMGNPIIKIINRIGETDHYKIRVSGAANSVDIIFEPVFDLQDLRFAKRTYRKLLLAFESGNPEELVKGILQEAKRENNEAMVMRSFQISGFGIWNCDRLYLLPVKRNIVATLKDANDNVIEASNVFVADRKVNTIFNFNPNNITYNPKGETLLWIVLKNGKLAVFSPEDFKKLNNEKEQTLKLKIIETEINSTDDVKKILSSI